MPPAQVQDPLWRCLLNIKAGSMIHASGAQDSLLEDDQTGEADTCRGPSCLTGAQSCCILPKYRTTLFHQMRPAHSPRKLVVKCVLIKLSFE